MSNDFKQTDLIEFKRPGREGVWTILRYPNIDGTIVLKQQKTNKLWCCSEVEFYQWVPEKLPPPKPNYNEYGFYI